MCSDGCPKYKKRKLSGSTDGRGIKVAATATPGTLIHTATDSKAANEWDEVYIRATNTSASAVLLTVEWGGVTNPDDRITMPIPAQSGLTEVISGNLLQNAVVVRAFAATANVLVIHGYVNRYEDRN